MASAAQAADWVVMPATDDAIEAVAKRCRKLVSQRAIIAAGVAALPVPGLDWVTDVGMLMKLLPMINAEFGLSPSQIERLAPDRRLVSTKWPAPVGACWSAGWSPASW